MKKITLFTIIFFITVILSSCNKILSPPSIEDVETKFLDNYEDIMTVTNFLAQSEYRSIYIHDTSGIMAVGTSHIPISDSSVTNAIQRLHTKGYTIIIRTGNTIYFQQWTRLMDAGCGIAYSINHNRQPEIQYLTELIPLSQSGWYYYVDDYEQWRSQHSNT